MRPLLPALATLAATLLALALFPTACGSSGTGTGGGTTTTLGTGGHTGTGGATGTGGTTGTGGLPAGSCRAQTDCTSGDFCGAQVLPPFCGGMCDQGLGGGCQSDADCADAGTGLICDKPCNCFHGGAQPLDRCTKGCSTAADCGPSMVCGATHRCAPATCAGPADCTANFACTGGSCASKPCTKDSDCGNFCVNGSCSPILGTCNPAVP